MLSKSKRFRETQMGTPETVPMSESLKLSLFVGFAESKSKSPRSFDDGAPVGLGIVAAMSGDSVESGRARPKTPNPVRSDPIPIKPRVGPTPVEKEEEEEEEEDEEEEEMELSESYTCVISHVGGKSVRKRVYYDDGSDGIGCNYNGNSGVFFESPPAAARVGMWALPVDFLSCCFLCRKKLHGLDIFMYRGDKAFCSVECRSQQILSDEHKEKCRSEAGKPHDSSLSPYPAPLLFAAGVAAA